MAITQLTVSDFCYDTALAETPQGGGSLSALAGALGASLCDMVARLTLRKKGYEHAAEEMTDISNSAKELYEKLIKLVDLDCMAFDEYTKARKLPKDTDEQKRERLAAMQKALMGAAEVPLETARTALKALHLADAVVARGNPNAVTDGLVAAMLARTAVLGAVYNVEINLSSIKDEQYVNNMKAELDSLRREAVELESRILSAH